MHLAYLAAPVLLASAALAQNISECAWTDVQHALSLSDSSHVRTTSGVDAPDGLDASPVWDARCRRDLPGADSAADAVTGSVWEVRCRRYDTPEPVADSIARAGAVSKVDVMHVEPQSC